MQSLQWVRLRVASGDSMSMSTWACSTVDSWGIWGGGRGGVQVGVTHHLGGEQCLSGAAAEQTAHHAVTHVHVLLSVHTCSSWASSGITKNVLQPWRFLDFRMSPKMWSPMYTMSFPLAPSRSHTISVSAHRVHLSEHRPLSEEQRLPGVHQDQIEVGLPGPVGGSRLGLTWQVEECVKDIKALCVIPLDELVWVPFADLGAGQGEKDKRGTRLLSVRRRRRDSLSSWQRNVTPRTCFCYQFTTRDT
ncbi:hypothetical protein F7725_016045 [Dissostichus mawsoni]|uniref:Uncharacterized protein n=1 Tax=Dissostichus mawsoni TaxID=36200 RepID=A0A7J5Y5T2_DISMA|nr:hypothetical protein F7725_016045 [Dissostichus mawsoni]